jgi:Tol biopolymer transport system component
MFFDAARTDSIGAHDFYSATRPTADQPFAAPVRLERLSTTSDERDVWISPDGARAYFASDRDGEWTIFVADLR